MGSCWFFYADTSGIEIMISIRSVIRDRNFNRVDNIFKCSYKEDIWSHVGLAIWHKLGDDIWLPIYDRVQFDETFENR